MAHHRARRAERQRRSARHYRITRDALNEFLQSDVGSASARRVATCYRASCPVEGAHDADASTPALAQARCLARMTEVTARERFECPACGGAAEWIAAKQAARLPVLRHSLADAAAGGEGRRRSREHDLVEGAPRHADEASAAGRPTSAPSNARAARRSRSSSRNASAQNCDFCGSPALVPYDEIKAPIRPESLLPFKLAEAQVRDRVRQLVCVAAGSRPTRSSVARFTDTLHGVYLPVLDLRRAGASARLDGRRRATTTTRPRRYRDSKGQTQTRQVRHVRWEPASAARSTTSSTTSWSPERTGVSHDLLRSVEPFPTKNSCPTTPAYVSGCVVEQYQIVLAAAAQPRQAQMTRAAPRDVRRAGPRRHAPQSAISVRRSARRPSSTSSCRSGC